MKTVKSANVPAGFSVRQDGEAFWLYFGRTRQTLCISIEEAEKLAKWIDRLPKFDR